MNQQLIDTTNVLIDVRLERERQDELWGEQNHPQGGCLGAEEPQVHLQDARARLNRARKAMAYEVKIDRVKWDSILEEELAEAEAAITPEKLREELVHTAAVIVARIESLDRNEGRPAR